MTKETNGGWIEEIPQLDSIELLENGCVRVATSDMQDSYSVDLHPMHLRFIAEKMGLVREMSVSEADALRTVDKLTRRIRVLHERIVQMDKWLNESRDLECADITVEFWFSAATLDLSREFIREIDESAAVVTPLARSQRQEGNAGSVTPALATRSPARPAKGETLSLLPGHEGGDR